MTSNATLIALAADASVLLVCEAATVDAVLAKHGIDRVDIVDIATGGCVRGAVVLEPCVHVTMVVIMRIVECTGPSLRW